MEEWRKLNNEKLCNLCSSPNIIKVIKSRRMRLVRHVVCIRQMRNAYKILVKKHQGKRPLGRP
jgi:predicted metal-binding protein